jgi:Fe-Mn family superoxide dismutase
MAYELPDLPYDYDALEPHIDERTMRIHHDKHHAGYTRKANNALSGTDWEDTPIAEVLTNLDDLPSNIQTAVRQNGGGFANHALFWKVMSPNGGGEPSGQLADAISSSFGSFSDFQDAFNDQATGRFGSGWAWLVVDDGEVDVTNTLNQNSPYLDGQEPILGLDVWEHAYYLNYQNERGSYVEAWWNVINWDEVERRYELAT